MEDWYVFNEDKLKLISLITAILVLIVAIYRWLLVRWRNDANLRTYARFKALKSSRLRVMEELVIEVPESQHISLTLESSERPSEFLYNQVSDVGSLKILLDMTSRPEGDYELIMRSDNQQMIKKVYWSGLY
jgi:4-amino-4-deoxy-L-arabinose transferase-like glycosyltransferase